MKAWPGEKIACTCAALVVVASAMVFGPGALMEKAEARIFPPYAPIQAQAEATEDPAGSRWVNVPWLPPTALSRDETWTYELFGPPEIHFDASSQQLKLASPGNEPAGADVTGPGGGGRAAIRRVPFRLQLVGHFGQGEDATGIFANMKTGETFLARAGREVPELGLIIKNFKIARQPLAIPDSMTTVESIAVAEVLDLASGEVITLTDREWACVEPAPIQPAENFVPVLTP